MEKKGEILKQLAIISDLLEHINMNTLFTSVVFDLDKRDFDEIYDKISKKNKVGSTNLDNMFTVKIGEINFVFNKNNV
jgi:flagellar hook assembly protein FlgD